MKKIIAVVLITVSFAGSCFAQEIVEEQEDIALPRPRNEVNFSMSYATLPQAKCVAGGIVASFFAALFGLSIPSVTFTPGCLGVEYNHYFNNVIALGGGLSLDYVYSLTTGGGLYTSVLPDVKFRWLYRDKVRMYSKLAAGCSVGFMFASFSEDRYTDTFFAWQITPVGFEFNTKEDHLKWFIDLGLGTQGLLGFGLKTTF